MSKKTVDFSELSNEELQVIQIISEASTKPYLDIANALDISAVEAYQLQVDLRKKMGVETDEELVKLAEQSAKDVPKVDDEEHIQEKKTRTIYFSELSDEEQQVIQIISEAIQNSTNSTFGISNALGISHIEAIRYRKSLRKKLGVNTNEELVELAEKKGTISIPEKVEQPPTSRPRAFLLGVFLGAIVDFVFLFFGFILSIFGISFISVLLAYLLTFIAAYLVWRRLLKDIRTTGRKILSYVGVIVGFGVATFVVPSVVGVLYALLITILALMGIYL